MQTAWAGGFGGGLELKQGRAVDFSGRCLGGGRQSWSPAGQVFLPGHVRGCRRGGVGGVLKPKPVTGQGFSQVLRGPPWWGRGGLLEQRGARCFSIRCLCAGTQRKGGGVPDL